MTSFKRFISVLYLKVFPNLFICVHAGILDCWPYNQIPYSIQPYRFTEEQIYKIRTTAAFFNNITCLRWMEVEKTLGPGSPYFKRYVLFTKVVKLSESSNCYTHFIGRIADIHLHDSCFKGRTVLHEMMHALGFMHEHQRSDRDCYIAVASPPPGEENRKIELQYFGKHKMGWVEKFPYDKLSVMHYVRSDYVRDINEKWYHFPKPVGGEQISNFDYWKLMYRFCDSPHYCDTFPAFCELQEELEADSKCKTN